jgi:hypothetical protein
LGLEVAGVRGASKHTEGYLRKLLVSVISTKIEDKKRIVWL